MLAFSHGRPSVVFAANADQRGPVFRRLPATADVAAARLAVTEAPGCGWQPKARPHLRRAAGVNRPSVTLLLVAAAEPSSYAVGQRGRAPPDNGKLPGHVLQWLPVVSRGLRVLR
jgi:hypothetical protein